jgi:hypothetical protein
MLELLYTSSKTLTGSFSPYGDAAQFIASWDAMFLSRGNLMELWKVFKDGTQAKIGTKSGNYGYAALVGGSAAVLGFGVDVPLKYTIYALDEFVGQPDYGRVLSSGVLGVDKCGGGDFVDHQKGLIYHRGSAGHVVQKYKLSDGSPQGTITLDTSGIYHTYQYAGRGKLVAISLDTGKVVFLDYFTETILRRSNLGACLQAVYDCLHEVFITVQADKKVKVFSSLPLPASLAAPSFSPATVKRLNGYMVQTRVLGAHNEPCKGWWVRWSLVGSPPKGSLAKTVSKSDEDGYAENYYYGPATQGELGQETLKVELVV